MDLTLKDRLQTDEAARLLGLEPARFRFLETHCEDFLSGSRLQFPRSYSSGDLKILAAASRLHRQGLPTTALKERLAEMLSRPSDWNGGPDSEPASAHPAPRFIAIASGKGGVGKSNIALSLGVELVAGGLRTALLDADLGVGNVHLLAGLKTGSTLGKVISGECAIEDVIARAPGCPDIVPGSSGIYELANLSAPRRLSLLAEIKKLESRYDTILVDAAAGVSRAVLDFSAAADFLMVITTAETTAITDAYALIKLSVERNPYCRIGVVANRVRSAREGAAALRRISNCVQRFMGRSVLELGCVWEDSRVRRAVNERVPFVLAYPNSRASAAIRKLAGLLRREKIVSPNARIEEKSRRRTDFFADKKGDHNGVGFETVGNDARLLRPLRAEQGTVQ